MKQVYVTLKKSLLVTGIIPLLISCGNNNENLAYNNWDNNNDKLISEEEFINEFNKKYNDIWELNNRDAYLDHDQFYETSYQVWDVNNDNKLDEEEWFNGYDYYYGDYIDFGFEDIDRDGDTDISYAEYYAVLSDTDLFDTWDNDANENLSGEEVAEGVFNSWDKNSNGYINEPEFEDFDAYYSSL